MSRFLWWVGPSSQQGEPARTQHRAAEQAETPHHREPGVENEGTDPSPFPSSSSPRGRSLPGIMWNSQLHTVESEHRCTKFAQRRTGVTGNQQLPVLARRGACVVRALPSAGTLLSRERCFLKQQGISRRVSHFVCCSVYSELC